MMNIKAVSLPVRRESLMRLRSCCNSRCRTVGRALSAVAASDQIEFASPTAASAVQRISLTLPQNRLVMPLSYQIKSPTGSLVQIRYTMLLLGVVAVFGPPLASPGTRRGLLAQFLHHNTACQPPDKQLSGGSFLGTRQLPPPGCLHLQNVCADQQSLVLFGAKYRADTWRRRVCLPKFRTDEAKYKFPWRMQSTSEALLPPFDVRAASTSEATPDLQHPIFAADIVPLLLYPTWQENYSHTIGNNIGWLYTHLVKSNASWADMVRLVLYTPHGLPVPKHWPDLVGGLTLHGLQSFADFSARNSNASRCFRDLLVCAADAMDDSSNVWQAAQHIAQHYRPTLPDPPLRLVTDYSQAVGSESPQAAATVLQVVFARRDAAAVLQIANVEELRLLCSWWFYRCRTTGRLFRAACGTWEFTNLTTSLAVVQRADVLVGMHGANMANSWFMRPGSSAIEIFPPAWPRDIHKQWLEQDPQFQLRCWALVVKDHDAYSPGALEQGMTSMPGLYQRNMGQRELQRDRNVRVPWVGVERVLEEVASTWGDRAAYDRAVGQHRQLWEVAGGRVRSMPQMPSAVVLRG